MKDIVFGCTVADYKTSGNYNYYLYDRLDNYALIMRAKTDNSEYRFRIILQDENVDTVWASATTETYVRPRSLTSQVKKYIVNKLGAYLNATRNDASNW